MQDKVFPLLCFIVFSVFTISELLSDAPAAAYDKEIPEIKSGLVSSAARTPVMTIHYCHSCGYQKAFLEYSQIIRQKYPDLIIEGSYHEPAGLHYICAKTFNILKILLIFIIMISGNVLAIIGQPQPRWWSWCLENKLYASLTIFFVFNMFENIFVSTGAFEISMNGIPLWSKLETGRIPQLAELFSIISNQFPQLNSEMDMMRITS